MTVNNEELKQLKTMPVAYYAADSNDEISLLDLWLVLIKRKNVFLGVLIVFVLSGLFFAVLKPDTYGFSTSIEIGTKIQAGDFEYIESPASVFEKINKVYIPLIISKMLTKYPDLDRNMIIDASLGKGSAIISLNVKGREDDQSVYFEILANVAKSIAQDHQRIFLIERKEIELQKNKINNQISALKEKAELYKAQQLRLNEKAQLVKERIENIKGLIADSERAKQEALRKSNTEGKALAMMMMDNDLRQANKILADLQEELHIAIENKRDLLVNDLAENLRLQSEQQDQLTKLEIQLDNLLETRAIGEPMRSVRPVGSSKKIVVLISIVVGAFIALFMVFILEFLEKVRNYKAEKNQPA
ncbi:MAG: Wzz/FepE/Etk N-terminal domain-containing protein [Gammaproteobacteria bacterium]|nr:Wzz/FepE/Etk N-terminal domain-containing protein [Gammaproteobacteria bacterium]